MGKELINVLYTENKDSFKVNIYNLICGEQKGMKINDLDTKVSIVVFREWLKHSVYQVPWLTIETISNYRRISFNLYFNEEMSSNSWNDGTNTAMYL